MVFVNSSLLMTLGVCSVYDLRYRRIPAIVVAITTLYIAVALGVMGMPYADSNCGSSSIMYVP